MSASANKGRGDAPGVGKLNADSGLALARRARNLRDKQAVYVNYVDVCSSALSAMTASRVAELREEGLNTEAHDALLAQLRGLRTRFTELDGLSRSLLLLAEEKGSDSVVWEELLGVMNALQAVEMEARAAQNRAALAAVFREYMGERGSRTRKVTMEVNSHLARRFNALGTEVRELQAMNYGRKDAFTQGNLLERLVAIGEANPELLVQLGAPHEIPSPKKREG